MTSSLGIAEFVSAYMKQLELNHPQFVRRLGYSNINKGLRRLNAVLAGNTKVARSIRTQLSAALDVPINEIDLAISISIERAELEAESEYRKGFVPHAIIKASYNRPSPIFVAAMLGVDRLLRIDFEKGSAPVSFAEQARSQLPEGVPAFGRTVGFFVNYTPDRAVEYDLDGKPVAELSKAKRIGRATVYVGNQKLFG